MRLSTTFRMASAFAGVAMLATACGGDGGDGGAFALLSEGELTVCSDIPYAPFEFEDPDSPSGYSGFDIELADAIAKELGLTMVVKPLAFDPIQSGTALNSNQCDIAASAMTITEEREANLDFTDAYFDADQSLLTTTDSGINALADLAGKKLGVQSATTGAEYAEENAPDDTEIVAFENPGDLLTALQAGTIDAILQDLPVNAEFGQGDDSFTIVETYPTGEQYGFAVAEEGREELLTALNDALQTLRDNGQYQTLFDKYFSA